MKMGENKIISITTTNKKIGRNNFNHRIQKKKKRHGTDSKKKTEIIFPKFNYSSKCNN